MIYCMSDIHGAYDRYLKMLQTINFSDTDTLYVIGDVIDRGSHGVDVVADIMSRKNVVFLRGNHEQMCLNDLLFRQYDARRIWQMNGGGTTRSKLLYKCSSEERNEILSFFKNAPTCLEIEVNETRFHLVHGFPSDDIHDRLWERPRSDSERPIERATVIVGHTPTPLITGIENVPAHIWHGNGIIDIDCGCGSRSEIGRLACIRLDDMKEYYI